MKRKSSKIALFFKDILENVYTFLFKKKRHVRLGIYGAPNSGKTTLANRMCRDWLSEEGAKKQGNEKGASSHEKVAELGKVSKIPHQTKQVQVSQLIDVKAGKKTLSFTLVDTPGIASSIDYEEFMKHGMRKAKARRWAREATKGVIESIKQLEDMDAAIILIDSSKDPYSQVNLTLVANLAVRNIPFMIAANKIDLRRANARKVQSAFPEYDFIELSAREGTNMDEFYETLYKIVR